MESSILRAQLYKYLTANLGTGILVVYALRRWVGFKVLISSPGNQMLHTYIAERTLSQRNIYVAVAHNLRPDVYHVSIIDPEFPAVPVYKTTVSIQDGEIAELNRERGRSDFW